MIIIALLLFKLGVVAFFLNLLYEILHSLLYTTCWQAPLPRYIQLMLKASIFDAIAIALLYGVSTVIFPLYGIAAFLVACIAFAWFWEWYSLKKRKWQYTKHMPLVLGVGLTPLIQLAVTGLLAAYTVTAFIR
jgi:hypothetical protein